MKRSTPSLRVWLALTGSLFGLAAATGARAQSASTAALSLTDAGGQSWAFLTWTSDDPGFLQRAVVAVYRKAGLPSAPGAYELVSVVRRSDDPAVIRAALQRSTHLGQNLTELDGLIQASFADLAPSPTLPLEEKVRIALAAARTDPTHDTLWQSLARSQPGLAAAARERVCRVSGAAAAGRDAASMAQRRRVGNVVMNRLLTETFRRGDSIHWEPRFWAHRGLREGGSGREGCRDRRERHERFPKARRGRGDAFLQIGRAHV